jgi:hypothetical protein
VLEIEFTGEAPPFAAEHRCRALPPALPPAHAHLLSRLIAS